MFQSVSKTDGLGKGWWASGFTPDADLLPIVPEAATTKTATNLGERETWHAKTKGGTPVPKV